MLYIYILSTNSYEGYKNIARARLMRYFEDYPQRNSIILFFPSLLRVDDKVNVNYSISIENSASNSWFNMLRFADH